MRQDVILASVTHMGKMSIEDQNVLAEIVFGHGRMRCQ